MGADPSARAARETIPWHERLEARVLVAVTLLLGASLGAVAFVTGRVVEAHSLDRARENLSAARAVFDHLIDTRAAFAHAQARLITTLPVFRAHMTDPALSSDRATMGVMAEAYCRELTASFCVVTSSDGRWLASPDAQLSPVATQALERTIGAALKRQSVRRVEALDGGVFLVVSEPAMFADEVLGTLTSAHRLDDAVASDLGRMSRSHVAFVADGAIGGSSVDREVRAALTDLMRSNASVLGQFGDVSLARLAGADYVGGVFPLDPDAPPGASGSLILLEDWGPTRRFIDDISRQMIWSGALVLLAATVGSVVLSRRMSRPLREIADGAAEIADGHWDRRVPVRGSAEATAMARAFNDMTTSLSHWHAEASRRTEQLQAAYERYEAVANSAHDAIVSADAAGVIVFWNRSAESTFGYAEAEATGLALAALFSEASRDACARLISDLTGDGGAVARTFEGEGLRNDGATFPLELTLASWRAGGATYVTAIIRDTTERKRAQDALLLRDAQLRQAQKMEAIGRLASGVAHDFNNALAVIQGYTEQVMACLGTSHEHYADLEEVLKSSRSAASLTRQLLAFSRKQALEPQVLSVSEVVSHVRRMLQRLAGQDVELATNFESSADLVLADRGQLEQVIVNLCVNARDAMPQGGRVEIGVTRSVLDDEQRCTRLAVAPGDFVTLMVRDTGHGMDAETAAHVFEPFFTTKEPGKGTGLGLATVYGIVAQSGGAIELDTAPGHGTTFRVHLPAAAQPAEADVVAPAGEMARGGETVLLVEDDDAVRAIVRRSLASAGYDVLEAGSGPEALALLRERSASVDVLLTDVVMPGMNGVALSEAVAVERPGARVLFMSGHAADAVTRQGFDASRARLLQKPFSAHTLCREVRSVLSA
jgi:PAS domain S-box-containing protein